jgi:CheY-like chemotaxis protein
VFKKIGVPCDFAENGLAAFEMFCKNRYDLIFMDINMPVMDGIEATGKIREYEAANLVAEPCLIVAMTASDQSEQSVFFEAGMNEYIGKPFKESDILRFIAQVEKQKEQVS